MPFAKPIATALLGLSLLLPAAAQARVGFYFGVPGPVWVGPPIYYPAPVYVPPPVIYAPPPTTYIQRPDTQPATVGEHCDAGAWQCPLPRALPVGAACSCPTEKGRVNGVVQ